MFERAAGQAAHSRAEHGNALVIAAVLVALLIVTTAALLFFTLARSTASSERAALEQSVRAVDSAIALKSAMLMRFEDRSMRGTFAGGTRYAVIVREHPQGDIFKLTAAARVPGTTSVSTAEVVIERIIASANSNFTSPLMAKQSIEVSGSSRVNGNNHGLDTAPFAYGFWDSCPDADHDGICDLDPSHDNLVLCHAHRATFPMHDKPAIASKKDVLLSGGAKIAGAGDATFRNAITNGADGVQWTIDRNQNACSGTRAAAEGHPGAVWGATADNHFPTTPDQALRSPDGTAKARAQQLGTLFTSEAQYTAWMNSLPGGKVPPNQLLYLDFQAPSPGVDLGSSLIWGNTYHTIIQHHPITAEVNKPKGGVTGATLTAYVDKNQDGIPDATIDASVTGSPVFDGYGWVKTEPDGNSVVKVPHVQFFGVFIVDDISNMNSGAVVFGGICSLNADDGSTHNFANGGAEITYSAAAIDRAIAINMFTGTTYRVRGYREHPPTRDAQAACAEIGVPIALPPSPEDAIDAGDTTRTADGWIEPAAPVVDASTLNPIH